MCAAKSTSRPTLQRVAKHLYRRGNSYEFRKVIPLYARAAFDPPVGTFSRSFGDVSRREADHLAAECRKYCDRRIAGALSKPDPTMRVASFKPGGRVPDQADIDRAIRAWVTDQEQRAAKGRLDREARKQTVRDLANIAALTPDHLREGRQGSLLTTSWTADRIAEEEQWILPPDSRLGEYLFDSVGRAQRELALRVKAELNFEDRPSPTHAMFDAVAFAQDRESLHATAREPVPIMDIFAGYLAEQQPAAKTVKKWRAALQSFIAHLGHDDAARVTPEDVIAWKSALLTPINGKARDPGTVRNGYLGAVKPVFGWAKENRKIDLNPVAGITVRVPRRATNRPERGYSAAEAKLVLRAALAIDCDGNRSYGAFARRWLPWLCAYTGARVTEMAQLRRNDVLKSTDGIWHIIVRPEAGSVKSRRARHVALHPHLIEQGFPDAVAQRSGPLFYDAALKRNGEGNSQAQRAGQRIAEWVRALGVDDEELQPNHGWRHAFISHARGRIDGDIRRAITGHSGKDEHDAYGDVSLTAMHEALMSFPRYRV